ncbi:MAG: response regulator transcription factor [Lachnospiraceae bacterium]|nr:response regulator transcription factor [Lachnospiraceae bacterium]
MIRIGVCEDDEKQANDIREIIERALFKRTEYEIKTYKSGEQLVQDIDNGDFAIDLLLLDINMNQLNGLEVAGYIRKNTIDVDIIFVTVSGEHVYEGYTYRAFSYLLKSNIEQRLDSELNRYMDERERVDVCLEVSVNGTVMKLPIGKIFYLESNARKVIAHMSGEDVEFYSKLDDLEEILSQTGFLRIHQSYLINELFVDAVSRESVIVNKVTIPMSRKYYERLRENGKYFGK